VTLKPGDSQTFHVRSFDGRGRFIREEKATWSLDQVSGNLVEGVFAAAKDSPPQVGLVKATVGSLSGTARLRIVPSLPIAEDFDSIAVDGAPKHWINTTGKYVVREMDGTRVLVKKADNPFFKRARSFIGRPDMHDYTIQADVRATEKRRQMGDAGVVAQRYSLVLFGNSQKIEIESWQPETARTVRMPFAWKADTWYRLKLQVENLPDGKVRARGKAWPASEAEPDAWMIEKIDPIPNKVGSPGIYADAPFEVFFDNVKVVSNK
jgi:hypothetical protein